MLRSKAAREGTVIRRKAPDIDRLIGRDTCLPDTQRRKVHALENAAQTVSIVQSRTPADVDPGDADPKGLRQSWLRQ